MCDLSSLQVFANVKYVDGDDDDGFDDDDNEEDGDACKRNSLRILSKAWPASGCAAKDKPNSGSLNHFVLIFRSLMRIND